MKNAQLLQGDLGLPSLTIVIPTHNRSAGLRRTLAALGQQDVANKHFEVVIVADGCDDDTAAMVRSYPAPYRLTCLEQPASGPAAARNNGAKAAKAPVLLFLDDDIEAAPTLVGAHLTAHESVPACSQEKLVVIGYLPTILGEQKGLFRAALRGWWEDMFQRMAFPGHRFCYTDLLSGNFSVGATTFWALGGFDTSLRCHEDYELGYRLIRAGARLQFVREARGWHHENTQLERSLRRKQEEGKADVALGTLYPDLRPGLLATRLWSNCAPLNRKSSLFMIVFTICSRLVRWAAFSAPRGGDAVARGVRRTLDLIERCRIRRIWRLLLEGLMAYWYWRGFADALPGVAAAGKFLHEVPQSADNLSERPSIIDLAEGIPQAEARLDRERPTAAQLYYGSQLLGELPHVPGAEHLRAAHLRGALATTFVDAYGYASLKHDEAVNEATRRDRLPKEQVA